jgi:predicted nucleic acid-binding Zn ribbon protein
MAIIKKTNDQPLGEVLKQWLKTYKHSKRFNQTRVAEAWSSMMGPTISGYTQKVYIRKDTLYIQINASALRQELSYAKDKIKNNLNEKLGENIIKEVVIH